MNSKTDNGFYRGITGAFLILLMHIVLLGMIGVLVVFFSWIVNYMGLIIFVICCSLAGWWYWFFRRTRSDGAKIKGMVKESLLQGKNVEVSFLGGAATFKIEDQHDRGRQIAGEVTDERKQLTGSGSGSGDVRSLAELARLYEKKLITLDEYEKAKKEILR